MLGSSHLVAFVATTDAERARSFYETTLGLKLVEQNPYACVFDAHGTQLRVTLAEAVSAAAYTVLGWAVTDIEDTVRRLVERGVDLVRFEGMSQDVLGVWTAPGGGRIAWFRDPDGNLLSVTQFSAGDPPAVLSPANGSPRRR